MPLDTSPYYSDIIGKLANFTQRLPAFAPFVLTDGRSAHRLELSGGQLLDEAGLAGPGISDQDDAGLGVLVLAESEVLRHLRRASQRGCVGGEVGGCVGGGEVRGCLGGGEVGGCVGGEVGGCVGGGEVRGCLGGGKVRGCLGGGEVRGTGLLHWLHNSYRQVVSGGVMALNGILIA